MGENIYTFIAVNYNNYKFTAKYIDSINNIDIDNNDKIRIIIVDNNSDISDFNNLKEITSKIENVLLIRSEENKGYFGGLNLGIEEATKVTTKNIIVGNNDLTFDIKFIKNLKSIDYDNSVMVIAPNIITIEGRMQNPHVIKEVSRYEKFRADIYCSNYYIGEGIRLIRQKLIKKKKLELTNNLGRMIIKRGIGACYILTENFFIKNSKLDDRVFMWGEEALLSNQVEESDGVILYDPSIKIIHHESATVKTIKSREKYNIIKNSYKIYRKYL